jgi:4'-phosphopantetheinyl transferase
MMSKGCIQDNDVLISFHSIEHLTGFERQGHTILEPKAVHLWGIELDGSPCCLERCAQWLDEEEQQRAARLVREADRQRYVLAHGGLRAVLSRYLGIGPDVIEMCRSEAGKPSLTRALRGQPAITFNMSHAQGRALIAVSQGQEVGVDLERIRLEIEVTKLSERFFAPSEHAVIMQATQDQRAAKFFAAGLRRCRAQGIGLRRWVMRDLMGGERVNTRVLIPVDISKTIGGSSPFL